MKERANNPAARVEVVYTDRFIMHCLMRVDSSIVLLSPFDHYRRSQIEGPAFLIDVRQFPHIGRWAEKELAGFAGDVMNRKRPRPSEPREVPPDVPEAPASEL